MTILERIKADLAAANEARSAQKSIILTSVIRDCDLRPGGKAVEDAEVIEVLDRAIKNCGIYAAQLDKQGKDSTLMNNHMATLKSYLP